MTRRCSTPPPFGSFSQKQPPGRGSIERFFASCEYVCSGLHHEPTCPTSVSYTFAFGALTVASRFTRKPVGVICGVDCAAAVGSRANAPNKYRRMLSAPSIRPPSRFSSLQCICRSAPYCCTRRDDETPVARQRRFLHHPSRL